MVDARNTQFKKSKVTLNLINRQNETIPCILRGVLAVHRDLNDNRYWLVTHAPTGSRVARFPFHLQRQAKLYATELEKLLRGAQTPTEVNNAIDKKTGERLLEYCAYVSGGGTDTFSSFFVEGEE